MPVEECLPPDLINVTDLSVARATARTAGGKATATASVHTDLAAIHTERREIVRRSDGEIIVRPEKFLVEALDAVDVPLDIVEEDLLSYTDAAGTPIANVEVRSSRKIFIRGSLNFLELQVGR